MPDDDPRQRLGDVPDLADAPLDWDPAERRFRGDTDPDPRPPVDGRRLRVPAPPEGGRAAPPPRRTSVVVAPSAEPVTSRTAAAPDRRRPRRWPPDRRTVLRWTAIAAGIVLLVVLGVGVWGHQRFSSIERVDMTGLLADGNGTNYLIVGSDTREGIDPDDPTAGHILGPEAPTGSDRSDTILILRVDDEGSRMLSVPRDLVVTIAETGQRNRINAAFNGGARRLVATLTDQLGLPVHHYLEIDFVAFRDLVDALGGIDIEFPHPAFDRKSGLEITEPGVHTLNGDQALAYVRSRFYTEVVDGREVQEGTGDLGRVVRQQRFLSAVVAEVGEIRNPVRLVRVTNAMVDGMRIDQRLGFFDAVGLLLRFRGLELEPTTLPTTNARLGGAQVLELVQPGADEVLAGFGSPGAAGS